MAADTNAHWWSDETAAWHSPARERPVFRSSAIRPWADPPGLRVLHVFRYFRPDFCGEGIYVEKLSRHLAMRGIRSEALVSTTLPRRQPQVRGGLSAVRFFGRPGADGPHIDLRLLAWLALRARRYDAVHLHAFPDRLFLVPLIARLAGCRVIQSCTLDDGFGRVLESYRGWRRPIARWLARSVHAVITISPALFEDTVREVRRDRVHLVPQGTDLPAALPNDRAAVRARLGLAPDEIILLYVGSISRRKGIRELIANHVALQDGKRCRLLLVGPDLEPDYAAEMRRRGDESGGTVSFAGYVDDPAPYYAAADIFVFASHAEGFGNVLLEAMAHGLPVVSRRLPGVTDAFIEDGRTGFLFDTDADYRALIARLAAESGLRRRLGAAARAAVRDGYDLCAIAGRYAAIYEGRGKEFVPMARWRSPTRRRNGIDASGD